jgi:hypothetical protein
MPDGGKRLGSWIPKGKITRTQGEHKGNTRVNTEYVPDTYAIGTESSVKRRLKMSALGSSTVIAELLLRALLLIIDKLVHLITFVRLYLFTLKTPV